jgi:hypothetical protein
MKRKWMLTSLCAMGLLVAGVGVTSVTRDVIVANQATSEYAISFAQDNCINADYVDDSHSYPVKTALGNDIEFAIRSGGGIHASAASGSVLSFQGGAKLVNTMKINGLLRLEGAFSASSPTKSLDIAYGDTDGGSPAVFNQIGTLTATSFPVTIPGSPNAIKIGATGDAVSNLSSFKIVYTCSNDPSLSPLKYTIGNTRESYLVSGFSGASLADVVIPDTYLGLPVINIESSAFANDTAIKTLTLGKNISVINNDAFSDCTALTSVTLPATNALRTVNYRAFQGCTSLTSFPLSQVNTVGYDAFAHTGLSGVVTVGGLNSGSSPFSYCPDITGFALSSSSPAAYHIESGCLYRGTTLLCVPGSYTSLAIASGTTIIADSAARGALLTSVTLASSSDDLSISGSAFRDCTSLASFDFTTASTVGEHAFRNSGLTEANLPAVSILYDYAFADCASLGVVRLGSSLSQFMDGTVFGGDYGLSNILFSYSSNTKYKTVSSNGIASADGTILYYLKSIDQISAVGAIQSLPSTVTTVAACALAGSYATIKTANVTTIQSNAFSGWLGSKVTLGSAVSSLETYAFASCPNLTTVFADPLSTILTSIPDYCFSLSSKLNQVIIPTGVGSIGEHAFNGDVNVSRVFYGGSSRSEWTAIDFGTTTSAINTTLSNDILKFYREEAPSSNPTNYWHMAGGSPVLYA